MKQIVLPQGASQHKTAGPYSPVLEIKFDTLVLISGQAPLNKEGEIIGETFEEQVKATIENCKTQLATAGCTLENVFKVTAYLRDLDDWPRFNKVYAEYMREPLPTRTVVQAVLLNKFKLEIEMWAVK